MAKPIEIRASQLPHVYLSIHRYVRDLNDRDDHKAKLQFLHSTMVYEFMYRLCDRLKTYNSKLQACCEGQTRIQYLARFLVTRMSLIKLYKTYDRFCIDHYDEFPDEISNVVMDSYLWMMRYKTHPRMVGVEPAPHHVPLLAPVTYNV